MLVDVQVVKVTLAAESIAEMGKLQMFVSRVSVENTETTSVGSSTPSSTSKKLELISTLSNSSKTVSNLLSIIDIFREVYRLHRHLVH